MVVWANRPTAKCSVRNLETQSDPAESTAVITCGPVLPLLLLRGHRCVFHVLSLDIWRNSYLSSTRRLKDSCLNLQEKTQILLKSSNLCLITAAIWRICRKAASQPIKRRLSNQKNQFVWALWLMKKGLCVCVFLLKGFRLRVGCFWGDAHTHSGVGLMNTVSAFAQTASVGLSLMKYWLEISYLKHHTLIKNPINRFICTTITGLEFISLTVSLSWPKSSFSSARRQKSRVDRSWRKKKKKHREDWEAAANEHSGALSHAHCTSVRWRQSPVHCSTQTSPFMWLTCRRA